MCDARDFMLECLKSIIHELNRQMGNWNYIINNRNHVLLHHVMLLIYPNKRLGLSLFGKHQALNP